MFLPLCVFSGPGISTAIQVTTPNPWQVALLFQPVVLKCQYDTSATQPPTVVWKYKSFCRDRLLDAFNPSSSTNQVNDQLQQADPNYDPYVNCPDASRTVRIVASKQGKAVTLDNYYQGRKITIIGDADLSIEQTAWGDSGVYYCTVTAFQDLSGNNEAYVELLVLGRTGGTSDFLPGVQIGDMQDWLFVVLVLLGALVLLILIGVCWCQCCPHTCCCYVRCPCCPERCCCPYALYHAGKAATAGVPSLYAPSSYAASAFSHPSQMKVPAPHPVMVPMTQFNGSYGSDFDGASSVGNHSRVPLLHDQDAASSVRSGYRIQANQESDDMRVLYYVEKELAHFDPRSPGDPGSKYENASAMSEISSLHEDPPGRGNLRDHLGRMRQQALPAIRDLDEESAVSSVSRQPPRRDYDWPGASRQRARSMESLDDVGRRDYPYRRDRDWERGRGRRESDSESGGWRSDRERDRRGRDRSPERRSPYQRRSRSRDDLTELGRDRGRYPPSRYDDDSFLDEVLRRKGGRGGSESSSVSTARSGNRKKPRGGEEEEDLPLPPPYTETESVSSSARGRNEKRLRKNDAVSRESLVV
ncbi:lipolysis-stimulated lipoprotein receptor [Pristis pectinata]|uniref:lipolysis-stimulated lipoprotein receptor n=1 Tax=Pristis pectinata TaxID=685728 RepID=UPI00223D4741|nr:lipolysis-stimulated lipoprotein receptor [Pristis pectinata]